MRASILSSVTSVANEIIAIVECLDRDNILLCSVEATTTAKWRDAFGREGCSSCKVARAVDLVEYLHIYFDFTYT